MVKFNCFAASFGKKENFKKKVLNTVETNKGNGTVQMKLEHMVNSLKENGFKLMYFNVSLPFGIQETSTCKVKVVEDENSNSTRPESAEACYEQGPSLPMGKDLPDSDLQTREINNENETEASIHKTNGSSGSVDTETNSGSERDEAVEVAQSGHISDPGVGKGAFRGSPKLKRSHSHVETLDLLKKIANRLPPKSQSLEELQDSTESGREEVTQGIQASPLSLMTSCSTDMVMLERLSSSQLLPSRSRRLWWKLFLWSHRNLHKPGLAKSMKLVSRDASNRKDGYRSDTLEASCVLAQKNNQAQASKSDLLGSLSDESKNRSNNSSSGIQDPNQWVAFPMESSSCLSRVDEWVNSLNAHSILSFEDHIVDAEGEMGDNIDYPLSPEIKGLPEKAPLTTRNSNDKLAEEVLQANNIIQSMNSSSAMAHIAGIGLKVIPNISLFASLRSVNLSGNFIAHIVPGSLPKSLHTLNLSRNKISAIEGLRELTRLRLLDLSYNRISRIGRGLSHCTFIKELYLAGNKISDVEGLHRLLKLTVLDLSFNKITTAKALGQLVANYNSLLALNLVGNPVQSNIGDDQLRKAVSGLLPQLAYLNKQPIKQKGAREVAMDSVAKAALGNGRLNPRKKMSRRLSQGSTSTKGRVSEGVGHRARHRSKSTNHQIPQPMRRLSA